MRAMGKIWTSLAMGAALALGTAHAQVSTTQTSGGANRYADEDTRPDPRTDNVDDGCFKAHMQGLSLRMECAYLGGRHGALLVNRATRANLWYFLTCARPKGSANKLAWDNTPYDGTIENLTVELSSDGSRYVLSGRCKPTGSHRHRTTRLFISDRFEVDGGHLIAR